MGPLRVPGRRLVLQNPIRVRERYVVIRLAFDKFRFRQKQNENSALASNQNDVVNRSSGPPIPDTQDD